MIILSVLIFAVAAILLLPTVSDLFSLLRSPFGTRSRIDRVPKTEPRFLILIPAHNEEVLLRGCLTSIHQLDYPRERVRVAVIADNCSDCTASIAEAAGAECMVREEPSLRGKPHAIAWALERLDIGGCDAVVVVDADSTLERRFARALARAAPLRDKAFQPYNDVGNRTDTAITRMAAIFSAVRTRYMNRLKNRANLNTPLANGLCLGADMLARHGWPAFSLAEDWELYAILTVKGEEVRSVPTAHLFSQEARSLKQSRSQRIRWSTGRFFVLRNYAAALLTSRRVGLHQKLDALGELTAPGPAVLLLITFALAMGCFVLPIPAGAFLGIVLTVPVLRLGIYALAAAATDPEPVAMILAFLYLPLYALWRVMISLRMIAVRQTDWTRTERHSQ